MRPSLDKRSLGRRRGVRLIRPVRNLDAHINVTPLIDVVLVLLIVFMVMTPMAERSLTVELPSEQRRQSVESLAQAQILVALGGASALTVNREPVALAQYRQRLANLLAGRAARDQVVFVVADDDVSYPRLVEAMDLAKQAGAKTVGLALGVEK